MKTFDVVALGELLVDFTENGMRESIVGGKSWWSAMQCVVDVTKPWQKDGIYRQSRCRCVWTDVDKNSSRTRHQHR